MPGNPKITRKPSILDAAEPADGAPQHDQRDADHDRRDRERQIHHALTRLRPRNLPRTSAIAMTTPNMTLSGTTISTMIRDRLNAEIAAGVVIESKNCADARARSVRHRMMRQRQPRAGRTSSRARRCAANPAGAGQFHRLACSFARRRFGEQPQHQQGGERDHQQRDRHRGGIGRAVDLDLLLDVLRGHLRLPRDVAADQHHRAVFTDRPGEGQAGTG